MKAVEWPLYDVLFQLLPEDDRRFIMNTLTKSNIIIGPGGDVYMVDATRMSGEMNTSLGNGWCNYVVLYDIVWRKGGRVIGYVEGDDGIFVSSVPVTTEDYQIRGFDVKVVHHESATTASFCGIVSSPDGTLLKDPYRTLTGFGWTSSFISAGEDIMWELLFAKSLSLKYEAPNCPILGVLADHVISLCAGINPRFVSDGYHVEVAPRVVSRMPTCDPSPAARETFQKVFGIPVSLQLQCEELIRQDRIFDIGYILPPMVEAGTSTSRINNDMLFYSSAYIEECD